jgi:hypothetical protein
MSAQTSYNRLIDPRIHGSLNDLNNTDVTSGAAEAAIAVGVAVKRGSAEGQVLTADGTTGYIGVAVRDLHREGVINTGSLDYLVNENVSVLRAGYINLTCPSGCTAGDTVKFVNASGIIDSGAAAAGETQIDEATWETTTAAGQVGIVRLKPINSVTAGS